MPRRPRRQAIALPVLPADDDRRAGTRMGRRRTIALVIVHVLVGLHVLHAVVTGSTLSPLEPSEAGHSIRTGAINAGAIFLCVLVLSTLVLGRFFCGWACHLVAYQDLARWILIKVGLRPQAVRARLLMLVPLFAVYWLYGKPLVSRWGDAGTAAASLHLTTDDFWATFPGPTFTIVTFLVCGFVIVYVLGAKGFCTYGCPYGALFGLADRVAPGRIRVNESCEHTGRCTTTCSSNVDVAREVATFGMVVDPGCMKCLDCVTGCPHDALSFGFRASPVPPPPRPGKNGRSRRGARGPGPVYDFSWPEELFMLAAFAGCFWVFFNLYRMVPFLLALGVCAIVVVLLVTAGRLVYAERVVLQRVVLKSADRLTGHGRVFAIAAAGLVAFTIHSAFVQWHTKTAVTHFTLARQARFEGDPAATRHAARVADALATCERWGLVEGRGMARMAGELHRWRGEPAAALACYERELAAGSRNRNVPMYQALVLLRLGRAAEARRALESAFAASRPPGSRFLELDGELARLGDGPSTTPLRLDLLRLGVEKRPDDGDVALALCRLLVRGPVPALRDPAAARQVAESVAAAGAEHADVLAMLAWLYGEEGRWDDAVAAAERSLALAERQGLTQVARDMSGALEVYRRAARSQR